MRKQYISQDIRKTIFDKKHIQTIFDNNPKENIYRAS